MRLIKEGDGHSRAGGAVTLAQGGAHTVPRPAGLPESPSSYALPSTVRVLAAKPPPTFRKDMILLAERKSNKVGGQVQLAVRFAKESTRRNAHHPALDGERTDKVVVGPTGGGRVDLQTAVTDQIGDARRRG
jgi:hypothetical protein